MRLNVVRQEICETCDGAGSVGGASTVCPECDGTGNVTQMAGRDEIQPHLPALRRQRPAAQCLPYLPW